MAKTGQKAAFKMGEARTAAVINPTKFVTATAADGAGLHYENLVDYARATQKINPLNDAPVADFPELKDQLNYIGYATRTSAVTEQEPLFNSEQLNMNNHDIARLKQQLKTAQANGNNLYEMAFSLRGDFLKDHGLYDPVTKNIDQTKLKKAEQNVVDQLVNKGFPLPLVADSKDLVWFGVIHQDTDHLNMHLWAARISHETRPDMLVHGGRYDGQPKGLINAKTISAVQRQFINQLLTTPELEQRQAVIQQATKIERSLAKNIAHTVTMSDAFEQAIVKLYQRLPQSMAGRWQVGNANMLHLNAKSPMFQANQAVNDLIDELINDQLSDEYEAFTKLLAQKDAFDNYDKGLLHDQTRSWGYEREKQFRKDTANKIYHRLNDWYKTYQSGDEATDHQTPRMAELRARQKSGPILDRQKKFLPKGMPGTFNRQPAIVPMSIKQLQRLIAQDVYSEVRAQKAMRRATEREAYEEAVEQYHGHSL
jgi:hypothetical protein